jgi:hypothetical protein
MPVFKRVRFTLNQTKADLSCHALAEEIPKLRMRKQHVQTCIAAAISQSNRGFLPFFIKFQVMSANRSDNAFKQIFGVGVLAVLAQQP